MNATTRKPSKAQRRFNAMLAANPQATADKVLAQWAALTAPYRKPTR